MSDGLVRLGFLEGTVAQVILKVKEKLFKADLHIEIALLSPFQLFQQGRRTSTHSVMIR